MRRLRTCLIQPLLLFMPSVRRWSGQGGSGAPVSPLSGEAAGLTDQQTVGQPLSWGTPPLPSHRPPMWATATPILNSPHAVPSAPNCTLPLSRLFPVTPCGSCPVRTPVVPHPNLVWTNRLCSPGSDATSRSPTTPRQSARTKLIPRTGCRAAPGAHRAASHPGRWTAPSPCPPSPAPRAGPQPWPPQQQQQQFSGRHTDRAGQEQNQHTQLTLGIKASEICV